MSNAMQTRFSKSSAFRFLLSGGFNTGVTYVLYLALLSVLSWRLSYTLAFATGIVLAYVLNRVFVFRTHRGIRSVAWLPLVYLTQYLLGMLVAWVWVEPLGWYEQLAPLAATLVMLPVTYLLSHVAFVKTPRKNTPP